MEIQEGEGKYKSPFVTDDNTHESDTAVRVTGVSVDSLQGILRIYQTLSKIRVPKITSSNEN
jgi:hypothetical protein